MNLPSPRRREGKTREGQWKARRNRGIPSCGEEGASPRVPKLASTEYTQYAGRPDTCQSCPARKGRSKTLMILHGPETANSRWMRRGMVQLWDRPGQNNTHTPRVCRQNDDEPRRPRHLRCALSSRTVWPFFWLRVPCMKKKERKMTEWSRPPPPSNPFPSSSGAPVTQGPPGKDQKGKASRSVFFAALEGIERGGPLLCQYVYRSIISCPRSPKSFTTSNFCTLLGHQ